jgi:hypothetical protein
MALIKNLDYDEGEGKPKKKAKKTAASKKAAPVAKSSSSKMSLIVAFVVILVVVLGAFAYNQVNVGKLKKGGNEKDEIIKQSK